MFAEREVAAELMQEPMIRKAVDVLKESSFTEAQLLGYEKFWDNARVEYDLHEGTIKWAMRVGETKGRAEGEAKAKGRAEGKKEEKVEIARNMKALNASVEFLQQVTGLSLEEIEQL